MQPKEFFELYCKGLQENKEMERITARKWPGSSGFHRTLHQVFSVPFAYRKQTAEKLLDKERKWAQKDSIRREYFFFGMDFIAEKAAT